MSDDVVPPPSVEGQVAVSCPTPRHCAFFLDLDGTLVEIAEQPAAIQITLELPRLIADLHAASMGALALISGRSIADIDSLLRMPRLPVAGQHGAERRDPRGELHRHAVDDGALAGVRAQIRAFAASHPGLLIEDKGLTLALHYRSAPQLEQAVGALAHHVIGESDGKLQVERGKMVFEIKPSGRDKGRAIEEFLDEPPFAGRMPVFVGDDVTDEYGFIAVNARGGVSIKVGGGESAARLRLPDVDAVHAWLRDVLASGSRNA